MQSKHDAVIVLCDHEVYLASDLVSVSLDNIFSLAEFSPDGKPAIFVARPEQLETANQVLYQMSAMARAQSIITGQILQGESLPMPQAPNAVFMPWSSEQSFVQWLAVLQGRNTPVSIDWFLPNDFHRHDHAYDPRLALALQELASGNACQLKLANLPRAAHCSTRQLGKLFQEELGITPGLLLRGMFTFSDTAKLMREEAHLLNGKRRGHSPLRSQADDYRRRLQRLLGLTYSELRQAAKTEHWAVVWMRRWRERLETRREGDGVRG